MKKAKKMVTIALIVSLLFSNVPLFSNEVKAAEKIDTVQTYSTSKTFTKDNITVTASSNGESITISGKTLFSNVKKVNFFLKKANTTDDQKYAETSAEIKNGSFTIKANTKDISAGEYYVLCRFDKNWDYFFRDVTFKKGNGTGALLRYTDILENNKNIIEEGEAYSPEIYKDKTLKHDYVLNGKALTTEQCNVIGTFTDKVVKGASNNYDKLKKMYEYLGTNLYYDTDAFNGNLTSEINPYVLITKLNSNQKVKTVCDGYSALMVAMARSEGIPCRLAQGTVRTTPNQSWANVGTKVNHTWVEAYVDGRWVIIDATRSTNKRYEGGKWIIANDEATTKGLARYQYFDPSIEFFSNAYRYKMYRNGSLAVVGSNTADYKSLQSFLTRNSNENGKKVNSKFNANDMSTWYNSKSSDSTNNIETNGFGKVRLLSWQEKGLVGSLNLSGLSQLKNLLIHSNSITSLDNLNDCVNLEQISANFNKITSLNADKLEKLKQIKLQNNLLEKAAFNTIKGKAITIKSSDKNSGTFSLVYDATGLKEKLTLKVHAKEGIDFLGCYDKNGKKVSIKATETNAAQGGVYYEFELDTTTANDYTLKFEEPKQLAAPNLKAKLVSNVVNLSWNKISGASGYEIYRATSQTGKYTKISNAPANWISLKNSSVEKGKTYYYKMVAFKTDSNGKKNYGLYSKVVSVKIPGTSVQTVKAPTSVSADVLGSTSMRIKWSSVSGASGYQIYRATTNKSSAFKRVSTVSSKYRSVQCKGLLTGKTYYWKVRAYKKVGSKTIYSPYSKVISKKTTLSSPQITKIEKVSSSKMRVRWNGVSGASGYQIYRATTNKSSAFKRVSTVSSKYRSVQCKGLLTGKTYYWKVRAYKKVGSKTIYSPYSKVISKKTTLSSPQITKIEKVSSSKMRVRWNGVSGASGYQIYRATVNKSSSYKLVYTASSKSRSLLNSNLKKGRTYYWKIRAYKVVDGKKVYSNYSKVKTGKIK